MRDTRTEHCEDCDDETEHEVRVELQEESRDPDPDRRQYSREPYRVRECSECGRETRQRMNTA